MEDPLNPGGFHYALLVLALGIVAAGAIHPHVNVVKGTTYEYPLHMDEYVHWGYAKAIVEQGTTNFRNPFTGAAPSDQQHLIKHHEIGYQTYLGVFQDATGLDWLTIFKYGPTAVAILFALTLYAVAQRFGAGVEAAAFTACIPTTLRFLGPAFLVPIVWGCLMLVATAWVLFNAEGWRRVGTLAFLGATAWTMHAMAAVAIAALVGLYAGFHVARNFHQSLLLILGTAIPFIVSWSLFQSYLDVGPSYGHTLPLAFDTWKLFGWLPLLLAPVGFLALIARGHDTRPTALTLATLLAFYIGILLLRYHEGQDFFRMYDRSWMVSYTLAALLAAIALGSIRRAAEARATRLTHRLRWMGRTALPGLLAASFVIAGTAAATSVVKISEQPYYRIMNDRDYEAFVWVRDNLPEYYEKGVVRGLSSMPFSIITGRPAVYTWFPTSPESEPDFLRDFFKRGADTATLLAWRASIVYSNGGVSNPDLDTEISGVHILREDFTKETARPAK